MTGARKRHRKALVMPKLKRSPFVETLAIRRSADVTPDEWRTAFAEFKAFPYRSRKMRLCDCEDIVSLGLGVLTINGLWQESIQLADWALVNRRLIRESDILLPQVYYYKSLALLKQSQSSVALECYLKWIRSLTKSLHRRLAYLFGIHLFKEFKPRDEDEQSIAPADIIRFARELFAWRYPTRNLPVPLRKGSEEEGVTWAEVHKALCRFLKV